jgi:hypothetical protein
LKKSIKRRELGQKYEDSGFEKNFKMEEIYTYSIIDCNAIDQCNSNDIMYSDNGSTYYCDNSIDNTV